MTLWIIYLTSTHPKLSKNIYVYCIIPSSLFTTIYFKRAKTVCLQELNVSFCGVLNELTKKLLKKRQNRKSQTRQRNKKGGREGESNDSPEIPDRGVRHQTSLASLPGGTKFCTLSFHLTHFTPGMDIVLSKSAVYT